MQQLREQYENETGLQPYETIQIRDLNNQRLSDDYISWLQTKALKNTESSSRIIHSQPQPGFRYHVKLRHDSKYEVAKVENWGEMPVFRFKSDKCVETSMVSDWKREPIPVSYQFAGGINTTNQ